MAGINYWEIEQAIVERLKGDDTLVGVAVLSEADLAFNREPTIIVYLERRDATPEQSLSAHTRLRQRLRFSIVCYEFSLEINEAQRRRDDLIHRTEIALMNGPTAFGRSDINFSFLEGGEFDTSKDSQEGRFVSAGEVILIADCTAVVE